MMARSTKEILLALFPCLSLSLFLLPVLLGGVATILPALGFWPALGGEGFTGRYLSRFLDHPAVRDAFLLTLTTGFAASFAALFVALFLLAGLYGTKMWAFLHRILGFWLAIPHVSFTLGILFLLSPSGWLMRLLASLLTGWTIPPNFSLVADPWGLSLAFVLACKEIAFLLFMGIAALSRIEAGKLIWLGKSFGYGPTRIWLTIILPQLYPHLRLSFWAVLAYSLSVVDVALIIGPSRPPTLAVLVHSWFIQGEASSFFLASAGATSLCLLVLLAITLCYLAERLLARLGQTLLLGGGRSSLFDRVFAGAGPLLMALGLLFMAAFAGLALLSVSRRWRFPDILPASYSWHYWYRGLLSAQEPIVVTLLLGVLSALISLVLVVGCLEYERVLLQRGEGTRVRRSLWLLYLPFLLPQISFVFGLQMVAVFSGLDGSFVALLFSHVVFVLPYVFITLGQSYRSFDNRYFDLALSLRGSWWRALLQVKLPMLKKTIAFSLATGFSVSLVQYLPTLYVGAGRFPTITTEAVNRVSGGDMRVTAVYALLQLALPLLVYSAALFFSRQSKA
ncbi:related to ABC transporter, permease protein [Desulfotalea psychrophila LSv54]|uniref:Related to ABC transporter, permease protein n=2 Tax=Desulfotalea psychrophila TaxID=84980 RepID=Q6ARH4_DESPS|nr:related to ABC transporter, permease protein [Desulfotalea psychrophila LSv54]